MLLVRSRQYLDASVAGGSSAMWVQDRHQVVKETSVFQKVTGPSDTATLLLSPWRGLAPRLEVYTKVSIIKGCHSRSMFPTGAVKDLQ